METCTGCGAVADRHPIVGVTRDQETSVMTAFPVCYQCWVDPGHRQFALKMHFFDQSQGDQAAQAAEDNILVSPPEV